MGNKNRQVVQESPGAPIGNKNAEKWTEEEALKLYDEALRTVSNKEKRTIFYNGKDRDVNAYKYDFIGELARDLGTYHQAMKYLAKKFPKQLKQKHAQVLASIESNCFFNAKLGYSKEGISIANLKANFKWAERTEIDQPKDNQPFRSEKTQITFGDEEDIEE